MRMVADVSAVADPNTGVQVYGPVSASSSGWMIFGGTSVAAPVGVYGVNGATGGPSSPYQFGNASTLNDVTSGSNGRCRGVATYYCNAVAGYDGPTGRARRKGPAPSRPGSIGIFQGPSLATAAALSFARSVFAGATWAGRRRLHHDASGPCNPSACAGNCPKSRVGQRR